MPREHGRSHDEGLRRNVANALRSKTQPRDFGVACVRMYDLHVKGRCENETGGVEYTSTGPGVSRSVHLCGAALRFHPHEAPFSAPAVGPALGGLCDGMAFTFTHTKGMWIGYEQVHSTLLRTLLLGVYPSRRSVSLLVVSSSCLLSPPNFTAMLRHPLFILLILASVIKSLVRHTTCRRLSIFSKRMRSSVSTTTLKVSTVETMAESAVAAEIMNMMTIWSRAACSTEEPPRMAPVIMPGMYTIPSTLAIDC